MLWTHRPSLCLSRSNLKGRKIVYSPRKQAGICFLCVVYTYFRLPEPRGRSFAELDVLFEHKVPARKFAKTEVDVFEESVEGGVMSEYQAKLQKERGNRELA